MGKTSAELPSALYCPECSYDLRGLTEGRCPECGNAFDRALLALPAIPWERRRQIGYIRAYVRTALIVMFHPSRLGAAGERPVNDRSARLFRWWTVVLTYVPVVVAAVVWYLTRAPWRELRGMADPIPLNPNAGWLLAPGTFALWLVGLFLFLVAVTALPALFFQPRSLPLPRRQRALSLSYYASAPLISLPWLVGLWWAVGHLLEEYDRELVQIWPVVAVLSTLVVLGILFTLLVATGYPHALILLRQATSATAGPLIVAAVMLPILAGMLAVLCLGGTQFVVSFVVLVLRSLTL